MSTELKQIVSLPPGLWGFFACAVFLTVSSPLVVRSQTSNVQYTNKTVDLGLRGNLTVNPSTWAMGSGDYTFVAWIKVASHPAAKLRAIFQKDAVGERQVSLQFDNLFTANSINLIHFNDDGTMYWRQAPANSIAPNTWYHVAGFRSGASLSIYIDGVSQTLSNPYSNGPLGTMKSAASVAYIGRHAYGGNEDYFNGLIDEARVSNMARSADWIKTEYNNQSSPASFYAIGSAQ